mmetsp:Transcript_15509/g.37551  ORF Transcript_15509/g.37551 Transcript_15509/m.37551 type:complete len:220 (-) Transcript_15509:427-1086(-)
MCVLTACSCSVLAVCFSRLVVRLVLLSWEYIRCFASATRASSCRISSSAAVTTALPSSISRIPSSSKRLSSLRRSSEDGTLTMGGSEYPPPAPEALEALEALDPPSPTLTLAFPRLAAGRAAAAAALSLFFDFSSSLSPLRWSFLWLFFLTSASSSTSSSSSCSSSGATPLRRLLRGFASSSGSSAASSSAPSFHSPSSSSSSSSAFFFLVALVSVLLA